MMEQLTFKEIAPSAVLSRHIECYWQTSLQSYQSQQDFYHLPPQGTFDLIFNANPVSFHQYDGSRFNHQKLEPGCWLLGQQTRSYYWQAASETSLYGIRIKPFALFSTKAISTSELKNTVVNLETIGVEGVDEAKRLLLLLTSQQNQALTLAGFHPFAERVSLQLFKDSLYSLLPTRILSNVIMLQRGNLRLAELCQQFELSKVTLRQKFLNDIGLLPKELCKVWRINNFLLLKQYQPQLSLTELGLQAGYYDQAHLTREFKAVFSMTPSRYFKHPVHGSTTAAEQINRRFNRQYAPFH